MQNNSLTIHLSEEVTEQLDQAARQSGCSRDGIAQQAVADWLAWQEEKHQMILEALEDVDQNRVYSQADMEAWAESHIARNAA